MKGERSAVGRSTIVAVVLSGLAPGAGHVYAGHLGRGGLLLLLLTATSLAWAVAAPVSWTLARLLVLPPALLALFIVVDSGRLARRGGKPFRLSRLNRWWVILAAGLLSAFVMPALVHATLSKRGALLQLREDSMWPSDLFEGDVVVVRRLGKDDPLERGQLAAFHSGNGLVVRRVAGLPGERVSVRLGVVEVDGREWASDPLRNGRDGLVQPELELGPSEFLMLSDARDPRSAGSDRVPRENVVGLASYVLVPADLDILRMGEPVQ